MNVHRAKTFKLPRPYDVDIEQQLLGCLLMFNERLDRLLGYLEPNHFAEPMHQRIYEAVVAAVKAGKVASPFTLKNEFEADTAMAEVGGPAYLATLCVEARRCLDAFKWAEALRGMAFRRHLIQVARDIQDAAQDAPIDYDPERLSEYAERAIADATGNASPAAQDRFRPAGEIAGDVLRQILSPKGEPTVLFGLTQLDEMTGGMRPKELVIIGARPGMGKTAVAGHIATAAARQGHGVALFSMEMSAPAIMLRLLTAFAYESGHDIAYEAARKGRIGADDQDALCKAEAELNLLAHLRIHEGRGLAPAGIMLAAKRLQNALKPTATPLGLIVIDHIQKIRPDRDMRGNKVAEMTEISDTLQKMAGQLSVPVVALSQLNRLVEGRTDRRPELSDLRESGAIEQDADLVLLLYREAYYLKKKEPQLHSPEHNDWFGKWTTHKHKLDIQIAKQRNGSEGRCTVYFDAPSSALKDQ